MRLSKPAIFAGTLASLLPTVSLAHAFGQQYTLPLPQWLYVYGGAAVVALSFILIGLVGSVRERRVEGERVLFRLRWLQRVGPWLGAAVFALAIYIGLLGRATSPDNFVLTFFWIYLLLGVAYLSAIVGGVWELINPWRAFVGKAPARSYPGWLGYWPAFFVYLFIITLELVTSGGGANGTNIALFLLGYSALTVVMTRIFGGDAWFRQGEFFNVFFGLFSRLAPFAVQNGKFILRPSWGRVFREPVTHISLLLIILFALSSTIFDGFRETTAWAAVTRWLLSVVPDLSSSGFLWFQRLLLFASPFLFLTVYLGAICAMKRLVQGDLSIKELALRFAPSLIPIALAYNVAHYYTLLLIQGQSVVRSISDPLGWGWDLVGTAGYRTNIHVVDASFVWHSQLVVIIAGHVLAVYLAHRIAGEIYRGRSRVMMSQIPMLAVMILYTLGGLWVLSQPLAVGR